MVRSSGDMLRQTDFTHEPPAQEEQSGRQGAPALPYEDGIVRFGGQLAPPPTRVGRKMRRIRNLTAESLVNRRSKVGWGAPTQ